MPSHASDSPSVPSNAAAGEGHVFWLTGLPAAGKTTLARALAQRLDAQGLRALVLDGDELRRGLCADLGMSDADRRENIRRAGEVALLLQRAGLHVICAFVSPFAEDRQRVRRLFAVGQFTEVHVSTCLEVCMARDPKGLYAKARRGELHNLTGWDAPFEAPVDAEFRFDSHSMAIAPLLEALCERAAASAQSAGLPHCSST
ncbi:adenylyl-sulfate kinase [Pseudomonas sp. DTU_2021_1001937_2_SI_NGA_ILE_001]|uniref:adenylyl-sulfate kinase n=1 Tax=Pseudomonas sp. DTU_2021_1001937_2_SI_NGA_ILE_001 TaxID=3077589 RepID=UPI0028FC29EC|nr:adenylyl-sulfate kinase [Pseudomonas sp. DTU_2021_1001937_2_SI_NGA_ILE_001]WNW10533.1 adenylyl-sulfate kinase [Pseudomonas sp. DTU_2021_1001937_2_SI_NGA_ILE_001]